VIPEAFADAGFTVERLGMDDGFALTLARIGPRFAESGHRPVILGHGVGFATLAYRGLWQTLSRDREVVAVDLRGHGLNAAGIDATPPQARLAADQAAIARHLATEAGTPPDALFHSYSGVLSLHAEQAEGRLYHRRVFMEPPLIPAGDMEGATEAAAGRDFLAERVKRRKDRFASRADFARIFRERPEFAWMEPGAPDDLAAAVLVPAEDGGFRLACPPVVESGFYAGNTPEGLWDLLARAKRQPGLIAPSLMIAGRRPEGIAADPFTAAIASVAARAAGFDLLQLADITHMLPMERSGFIAAAAAAFFDEPATREASVGG
jgi:pimeloyl-ACP methyl ester carboxylesterase